MGLPLVLYNNLLSSFFASFGLLGLLVTPAVFLILANLFV
jgi:hypothetical protein